MIRSSTTLLFINCRHSVLLVKRVRILFGKHVCRSLAPLGTRKLQDWQTAVSNTFFTGSVLGSSVPMLELDILRGVRSISMTCLCVSLPFPKCDPDQYINFSALLLHIETGRERTKSCFSSPKMTLRGFCVADVIDPSFSRFVVYPPVYLLFFHFSNFLKSRKPPDDSSVGKHDLRDDRLPRILQQSQQTLLLLCHIIIRHPIVYTSDVAHVPLLHSNIHINQP